MNKDIVINPKNLLNLKEKLDQKTIDTNRKLEEDCNELKNAFMKFINEDLISKYDGEHKIHSDPIKLKYIKHWNVHNIIEKCKINNQKINKNITQTIGYDAYISLVREYKENDLKICLNLYGKI